MEKEMRPLQGEAEPLERTTLPHVLQRWVKVVVYYVKIAFGKLEENLNRIRLTKVQGMLGS